jgi:hypothetical protein
VRVESAEWLLIGLMELRESQRMMIIKKVKSVVKLR